MLFANNIVDVSKNLASFFTVRNLFCFPQSMMKTTGFDYFQTSNNAGQWIEHNYKAYANLGDPNSDKI